MSTRLKAERQARGWSQSKLISLLRVRAEGRGVRLPSRDSMVSLVSRWENGHVTPSALYAGLLREVFGLTDGELGLATADAGHSSSGDVVTAPRELALELARAARLVPQDVALLREQTQLLRMLDRPYGAIRSLDQLRAHMHCLEGFVRFSVSATQRSAVAGILADSAALAGWMALDVGAVYQAWDHFEMAKTAAHFADDRAILAYATGQQAFALLDLGHPGDALTLMDAAAHDAGPCMPPAIRLWQQYARAELLAASGDEPGALTALEHGDRIGPRPPDPCHPYLELGEAHLARWRGHVLARLNRTDAIPVLDLALRTMDPRFRRATAALLCDLAGSLAGAGEAEQAARHKREAQAIARDIGSVRQARRLSALVLPAGA